MFYKMKLKTVERSYNEIVKKLEESKNKLKTVSSSMLRKLLFAIKEVNSYTHFADEVLNFVTSSHEVLCKLMASLGLA